MVQSGGQPVGKPALQGQLEDLADARRVLIDFSFTVSALYLCKFRFSIPIWAFLQKLENCRNVDGPLGTAATGVTGSYAKHSFGLGNYVRLQTRHKSTVCILGRMQSRLRCLGLGAGCHGNGEIQVKSGHEAWTESIDFAEHVYN